MVRHEALTDAVRHALETWPLSQRELAKRAGVPHGTLVKIANAQLGASEDVAAQVLAALDEWREEQRALGKAVTTASRAIRQELRRARRQTSEE